jgi:hypothetical protein
LNKIAAPKPAMFKFVLVHVQARNMKTMMLSKDPKIHSKDPEIPKSQFQDAQ